MHLQMRSIIPMDQDLRLLGPATSQTMEPVPWNHTVPMAMPWFQGQNPFPSNYPFFEHARRLYHNKRKGDDFDDVPAPTKQYISEEAMAARMNQMHISNAYSPMPSCSNADDNLTDRYRSPIRTLQELEARLQDESLDVDIDSGLEPNESHLVLAPEISEIKTEPILPRSIVSQIQKPALELVLWKPPGGLVEDLIRSVLDGDDSNKNSEKNHPKQVDKIESMASEITLMQNFNTTSYRSGQPLNFRSYTVPAMSQHEINTLEEEMNL